MIYARTITAPLVMKSHSYANRLGTLGMKLYPYLIRASSAVKDEEISKTKGTRIKNDSIPMKILPTTLNTRSLLYILLLPLSLI